MTRLKYLFLSAVVGGCVLLSLVCAVVAALPAIMSTSVVQSRVKALLSSSLKRSVTWSTLDVSWSKGLSLRSLRLGTGPAPLETLTIGEIVVVPSLGRGEDHRFFAGLSFKVKDVDAAALPGPPKPPPKPKKDPLTLLSEGILKFQRLDFPLPVDVRVHLDVSGVRVAYADPRHKKSLLLEDCSFRYAMPSVSSKPVELKASGAVSAMGKQIGAIGLTARISGLATSAHRLHPASATIESDAFLPGGSLKLRGGLQEADGVQAGAALDLSRLHLALLPLLPSTTPAPGGNITLDLKAYADKNQDLHASVRLLGKRMSLKGGALKKREVAPLDLDLHQQIESFHKTGLVRFSGGQLVVATLMDAAWEGSVKDPAGKARSLDLLVGPVNVDLTRGLEIARPFLPPNSPLKALDGRFGLRKAAVHLKGKENDGSVEVEGVMLSIDHAHLAPPSGEVDAKTMRFDLKRVVMPLKSRFPTEVAAGLEWGIGNLAIAGKEPVHLSDLHGGLDVALKEINLRSRSPRRITLVSQVTNTLDIGQAKVGKRVALERLHEQLKASARMGEEGEMDVSLPEARVSLRQVRVSHGGKDIDAFPLTALFSAEGVHIPPKGRGKPDLRRAKLDIDGGRAINVAAEASLSASSPQLLTTSGKAAVDFGGIVPVLSPLLPKGLVATGTTAASWKISLPLPNHSLGAEKNALRRARSALALIDGADVTVSASDLTLKIPAAKGAMAIKGMSTTEPLRVRVERKGDGLKISGGLKLDDIAGLAGKAGALPVRNCGLHFDGSLLKWKEFRLNEELRIASLGLEQIAEITVDRIDPLLEETGPISLNTLLKRLDIVLFTNLDASFHRELKPLVQGVEVSGDISLGGRVDLTAGKELRVTAFTQGRDFGLRLANGTAVEGVTSDLAIDRAYALAAPRGESWVPLSAGLVRPVAELEPGQGASDLARRIREDLRGGLIGARTFRIRKISTRAGGIPLVVKELEGDILVSPTQAGVSYLQGDLLGGTVRAAGTIDLRPEVPILSVGCSFTNLDTSLLVQDPARKSSSQEETEVSGDIALDAPVATDQRELLEGMRMKLSIHKIGPGTLERALFSLDPFERNEQVLSQRKLLRMGGIKWLRAGTVDGALNVEGEAFIKGAALKLPSVERVRLSELPIRRQTVKLAASMANLRKVLDLARADMIIMDPQGKISLKRSSHGK